jgi:K+/H+ antiporter YhaU regulatory subunit KhtT
VGVFQFNSQENKKMTIIKIDDKDYDTETLSDEAKSQIQSIQFVDQELVKLNAQAAVMQTARIAYAKALNDALGTELVFNS